MSVHLSHRGTGLAERLVKVVVEHASQPIFGDSSSAKYIVLGTTEYQPAAIKFYKKMGFKTLAIHTVVVFRIFTFNIWKAALTVENVDLLK